MHSESLLLTLSSHFCRYVYVNYSASMIFSADLSVKHQRLMLNDFQIFVLPRNEIRLGLNDPVLKDVL